MLCCDLPKRSKAASPLIILSKYAATMNIGEEYLLKAVTSDLSFPKFKSSQSSIASVNAFGLITAKKEGTCKITVKSGSSETFCQIQVKKTLISLNQTKVSLERGESFTLNASTSNGHKPTFRCNKKSVALVSEDGIITAIKPGEAIITVKADYTEVHCSLTVKKPTIQLNTSSLSLYRNQTETLTALVSSGIKPTWKSNRKSVAVVDAEGNVTAVKHGTAIITATVDGVKQTCYVTVNSPSILLNKTSVTIQEGTQFQLEAKVSSGIIPDWSSNKSTVATVDQNGLVTARKKGTAIIRAKEDGTIASCTIIVIPQER